MAVFEFLLLLSSARAVVGESAPVACPYVCDCDAGKMLVDCSRSGLSHVPVEEIPTRTRHLGFDGNSITRVPGGTFSRFRLWLRSLSLANNNLERVSNRTFSRLLRLESLDLSGNLLSAVPPGGFQWSSSLLLLDLSRNYLQDLPGDCFLGLSALQELNLNSNHIQSFQEDSFSNLLSLRRLSVADNQLIVDPVGWFHMNTMLEEMHLSGNEIPLTARVREWFNPNNTVRLSFLSLANNNIKFLPHDVFWGLWHLELLDLGSNQLMSIEEFDFRGLHRLRVLKLGANAIYGLHEMCLRGLSNLSYLALDGNQLVSLPANLFTPVESLKSRSDVASILKDISTSTTNRGSQELLEINLSSNYFYSWSRFTRSPALKTLNLSNNFLHDVPGSQTLSRLQILDLSNNQIGRVGRDVFRHNGDLREIRLDGNNLAVLYYGPFARLRSLRLLALGGNPWRCDCRLEWIQNLIRSEKQPLWAAGLADGVMCMHPRTLQGEYLRDIDSQLIQDQCPRFVVGVAMPVVVTAWFAFLGFLIARFWVRRCLRVRKFDNDRKSNFRYNRKRKLRRRRHGITAGQACTVTTKVSQRRTAFPLQTRGHCYQEVTLSKKDSTEAASRGRKVIVTYL